MRVPGLRIEPDGGTHLNLKNRSFFVKCTYVGFCGEKPVVCIDITNPAAMEPVKRFIVSYARVRGARYAAVMAGEKVWLFDTVENREVDEEEIDTNTTPPEPDDKDFRIAAAYYSLIHCQCGEGDEGNSLCGLPVKR